jgi:hypothetical protein
MTFIVMFRIVEDDMPPLPESCSNLLKDFLRQCFHKEPTRRPSAETLCEHEWLKQNWAAHNKEIRPQDSIPFLRRVSADMQKSEAIKYLAKIEMHEPERSTPESTPPVPSPAINRRLSNDAISPREHSFVKTTFGKRKYIVDWCCVWLLMRSWQRLYVGSVIQVSREVLYYANSAVSLLMGAALTTLPRRATSAPNCSCMHSMQRVELLTAFTATLWSSLPPMVLWARRLHPCLMQGCRRGPVSTHLLFPVFLRHLPTLIPHPRQATLLLLSRYSRRSNAAVRLCGTQTQTTPTRLARLKS